MGILEILVLVIASTISLLIGFVVLSKNSKNLTNVLFSLLSLTLFAWTVANYFSLHATSDLQSLNSVKTVFILVVIQNTLLYLFLSTYTEKNPIKALKQHTAYIALSIALIFLIYENLVVTDFKDDNIVVAPFIILFMIHALYSVVRGFIVFSKMKLETAVQKKFLLYGLLILWVIVPVTNFILPSFFNITIFVQFSSLYVLAFNSLIAYSIVRYKFFNLRSFVARASVYILTLAVFLGLYVSVILFLNTLIFDNETISVTQQMVYAIFAVISAPIILVTKREFDRLSSRIFYRDSYESQELIDELNKALVVNVDLESLLTKSALILQENLKTSFATFYIRETSYFEPRIIGAHRTQPEFQDLDNLQDLAAKVGRKVILFDENNKNEKDKDLKMVLAKNDIEVMARLVNTLDFNVKGIGYIFLGAKKSGTPYSKQDKKIIEIVANELIIAIENVLRFEEIEQFNVTLQKKIDDATKELKQTNEKLRALDEAKDEFVSMASHQLRTPLTSIKGYISMVLEGDAGKINETQKQMLGQAFFSSQRMVYLISDLLNVSRLKTGKFIIEKKPVYLPDVIESEIDQLYEGANAKNLTLSFTKPKEFSTLSLDEMKLRQVIMNFTDNAIYYTPSGGKITIELKETAKTVEFTVKDSGIGVPKDQQHKLFTKFYRADNARKARPDGTGLGLFMAKKVIIAQGGAMIFDSKENKGSTFGFSFPKEKILVTDTDQKPSK